MALRRTIIADKSSFLVHLDNMAQDHKIAAEAARTVPRSTRSGLESAVLAATERGIAQGLEIARRAVEAWDLRASQAQEEGKTGPGGSPPAGS